MPQVYEKVRVATNESMCLFGMWVDLLDIYDATSSLSQSHAHMYYDIVLVCVRIAGSWPVARDDGRKKD